MDNEKSEITLQEAKEYYINSNESLSKVSKKFNVSPTTLRKIIVDAGYEIRGSYQAHPKIIDIVLKELRPDNVSEISQKFSIKEEILLLYLNHVKSEAKKYAIEMAVKEFCETPKFGRSIKHIASWYGLNEKTLHKYLKEKGISTELTSHCLFVDEYAFDTIDTEEKAYWLGFLYADGSVDSKGNGVSLQLSTKDLEHVEKFKNFLKYEGKISITETHQFHSKSHYNKDGEIMYIAHLSVHNKNLHDQLVDKGCIPNKTLQLVFPDESIFNYDKNLIYAFIRGYFDGDGTLGYYLHDKKTGAKAESLMFVGTKPFLLKLQDYLGEGFLMQKKNCHELVYRLSYVNLKANRVAQLMYRNATIYLDRKYNIFINDYVPRWIKSGRNC